MAPAREIVMERIGDTGELSLRYPVYTILSGAPGGEQGLVVVEVEGQDCVLLFRNREPAELYLEQAKSDGGEPPLVLEEYRSDEELEHLLTQLPSAVANVLWDATPQARALRLTAVADLLAAVRSRPGP